MAKKAPIPTSIKITFNLSLLSDKVSKHKAETMEEGRTCIILKKEQIFQGKQKLDSTFKNQKLRART